MNLFLQRKSTQIGLLILSTIIAVFCTRGFIGMARQSNTWDVEQKWGAAVREMERSPPGIARAEKFLTRLKTIDTGYAPGELKQAIAGYISALEQSIEAMKAGGDPTPFDKRMDEAKQRMITIAHRYD